MRLSRQQQRIYILFILSMLFLGMCLEDFQAGSSLMYHVSTQTDSTLRSSQGMTLSSQVYKEENSFGQRTGEYIRQALRRGSGKTGRERILNLLSVQVLWQTFPVTFTLLSHACGSKIYSNAVIMDFIHHKDGKKA